jgi:hypothetical protein
MMRRAGAILIGSLAALAVLTAPVLAKNPATPPTEDKPAGPACHSYEQDANGEWQPVPCQEGPAGAAQRRPQPAGAVNATR